MIENILFEKGLEKISGKWLTCKIDATKEN
jgi:hypothetical protein